MYNKWIEANERECNMAMLTQAQRDELEMLIDATGLSQVLDAIAQICEEKADHVQASYGDRTTAGSWRRDARQIEQKLNIEN